MNFLNGLKTVIGLFGTAITVIVPQVDPSVVSAVGDHAVGIAQGAFGLLTVLGLIHKREKAKAKDGDI